jgi:hypothetical protein
VEKMRKIKLVSLMAMLLVAGILSTGCYVSNSVEANQVGLVMDNGVSVDEVVGSGRYTNMRWYAALARLDVSAKTLVWEDPDMWTADKQPVKFKVSVTYARKRDKKSVAHMWEMYNSEAKDDKTLGALVTSRIPRVAKQVTTSMTLDEMLGIASSNVAADGREKLQRALFDLLKPELAEFDVDLLDVGINDIGVDAEYANKLKEKAVSKVASELAEQKTKQLTEQVKQEQAQTNVDLEVAKRKKLVLEEENKIYTSNPEAYELERLRLLKDVIGKNDKIYFVPQGSDLNMILSGTTGSTIIPADTSK